MNGDVVFEVILRGATRAGSEGDGSYNGPLAFSPGFTQLVDVVPGDFEAVSRWYIGVRDADCARVSAFGNPARVVLDFTHGAPFRARQSRSSLDQWPDSDGAISTPRAHGSNHVEAEEVFDMKEMVKGW